MKISPELIIRMQNKRKARTSLNKTLQQNLEEIVLELVKEQKKKKAD